MSFFFGFVLFCLYFFLVYPNSRTTTIGKNVFKEKKTIFKNTRSGLPPRRCGMVCLGKKYYKNIISPLGLLLSQHEFSRRIK